MKPHSKQKVDLLFTGQLLCKIQELSFVLLEYEHADLRPHNDSGSPGFASSVLEKPVLKESVH
jgi:hypothetical protein